MERGEAPAKASGIMRLPPLNALRVFHAVMRQHSFRAAADELSVSPQAVSLQIIALEEALGCALFSRTGRRVEPTEQAILLAHYVSSAFDELHEGVRRVSRVGQRRKVNVNVSPYFAIRYLLDRLEGFRATEPEAELRLTTMVDLPDFVADDVDVAIQWGYGGWDSLSHRILLPDFKELCCTPKLARELQSPADLLRVPLLHPVASSKLWRDILAHLGVSEAPKGKDLHLHDAATMRRAALAGLGVGLISTLDAEEDLEAGRLVAPFGRQVMKAMPPEQVPGFYLVLPKSHRRDRLIAAFCKWVESEDWAVPPAALPQLGGK